MTTGSGTSDLMQQGINLVREGRYTEAYQNFRQVVSRDPNNEYAWIWISQTSPDMGERRQAIDRAFQINPNSEHARQALARLQQEEAAQASAMRSSAAGVDPTDLRAAMGARPATEEKGRKKPKKADTRASDPLRQQQPMVAQPVARPKPARRGGGLLRLLLFTLILIVLAIGVVWFLLNRQQNAAPDQANNPPLAETTPAVEITAPAATTTGPATGASTTAAVTTSAPLTTPAATTSVATTAVTTTSAATTAAASTSPVAGGAGNTPNPNANPGAATAGASTQLVNQAQQLVAAGDYKGAIGVLNDALKANPRDLEASLRLGSIYMTAPAAQLSGVDRYTEAINSFKRVTDAAPTWPGGFARLGEAYAAKGDVPAAINALTRSLELDPNGPERWLLLASLYEKNKQPAEASYARQRAQGINPTPAPATTAAPATTGAPNNAATTAVPTTVPPTTVRS